MKTQSFLSYFFCLLLSCLFFCSGSLSAQSCEPQVQHISYPIYDVYFLDTLRGFMASQGEVLKTVDGGNNWQHIESINNGYGGDFHFPTQQIGYFFNNSKKVYKTSDAGGSWDEVNFGPYALTGSSANINDICFLNADTGYVARKNSLLRTEDGGNSWQDSLLYMGIDGILDVHFVSDTMGYILGESGTLVRINLHQDWDTLQVPLSPFFNARYVWFEDANQGWVSAVKSGDTELYRTSDGGQNWTVLPNIPTLFKWQAFDSQTIYAVTTFNNLIKTNDGGLNWTSDTEPYYSSELFGLHFLNKQEGVVVGGSTHANEGRMIARTNNAGQDWKMLSNLDKEDIIDISFVNDSLCYMIVENRDILRSTDGGRSWIRIHQDNSPPIPGNDGGRQIRFFDSNNGVAFSTQKMFTTQDGGQSWTTSTYYLGPFGFDAMKFFNDSIWVKPNINSAYDSLKITFNAGLDWTPIPNNIGFYDLHIFHPDTMIGTSWQGIFLTTDGGHTWTQTFSTTTLFLTQIEFVNDSIGFVSGNDGAFLKSVDRGQTWTAIPSTTQADLQLLRFLNEDIGYASIYGGGFAYEITDGGQTWRQINSVPDLRDIEIRNHQLTYFSGREAGIAKTTQLGPSKPSLMNGAQIVCAGDTHMYSIFKEPSLDYQYHWQVEGNGFVDTTLNEATIAWLSPGQFLLSVRQSDACDTSVVQQMLIEVQDMFIPSITLLNDSTLVTDAPNQIQWYLNGNLIQGAHDDTLMISSPGSYQVRNSNMCGTDISDAFAVLSLQSELDFPYIIYPNPTQSILWIETRGASREADWQMMNQLGQTLLNGKLSGQISTEINVSSLNTGIYFLRIHEGPKDLIKKIYIR